MIDYKSVPFYGNHADGNHCYVAVVRMLLDYFFDKKLGWPEADKFVGYHDGLAAWTLRSQVEMAKMGLDVKAIEPLDYARLQNEGAKYLETFYSPEQIAWNKENSQLFDIPPEIPEFLRVVNFQKKRPTLNDIDDMLDEGRLVYALVNSRKLNGQSGVVQHAVLVIGRTKNFYIIHDPGLPHRPFRRVSRAKMWRSMGGEKNNSDLAGYKLKTERFLNGKA